MNKLLLPFIITFFAGISTTLGIIPTYINKKYHNIIINLSLAFSAGIMLTISIISLIPETIHYLSDKLSFAVIIIVSIFIIIGIILSSNIDKKLTQKIGNNKLYKLGITSIITLIIHNIPEGITTFITTTNNFRLGLNISIAIALHNIPEGISIAIPIYYSTNNRKKAILYTIIAGFSELFGAIISYIFLSKIINSFILSIIIGITSGIMIHISIEELIPYSLRNSKKLTYIGLLLGITLMSICILIFHI